MANFYNRNEKVFGWSIEVENSQILGYKHFNTKKYENIGFYSSITAHKLIFESKAQIGGRPASVERENWWQSEP